MVKLLPQNFPPQTPSAIASYSFTDIASGTGVVNFLGAVTQNDTTKDYILNTTELASNDIFVSGGATFAGNTAWTEVINKDFDVVFNLPQTIKGTAYLSVGIGLEGGGGGGGLANLKVSGAQIIHYDGTTETVVGTGSSETFIPLINSSKEGKNMLIPFTLTEKFFRAGDILRLSMIVFIRTTGSAGVVSYGFGADPTDRDFDTTLPADVSTKMTLAMPFRVDIGQ